MADLENLLLEAAGRTGGSGRSRNSGPPSRRRRDDPYSDDGSDDDNDDSDDNHMYGGKRSSSSKVPLKKRGKDRDDDQGSQDDDEEGFGRDGGSGDDSDLGSDLYKDEDDRQQLAQLTELEREMILSDRAMKLDDKKLHERMKSRWKSDPKPRESKRESTPPLASSRGVHTSARSADRAAHKADALNELRAKRMRQQGVDASRFGSGPGSRGYSPVKRGAFASAG